MIRLFIILAILLAGLIAGPYLIGQKGYVLIALGHWTVEMSVISLGLMLIGAILAFLLLEWLIKRILTLATGSRQWLGNWGERRRRKAFSEGLIALEENNLAEAEKQLARVDSDRFSGLNLLLAAQVALRFGQADKAREKWTQALDYPSCVLAARLHLSELALAQHNPAQALALLGELDDKQQHHPQVAAVWARALAASGKWRVLQEKLANWKKVLGKDAYQQWMYSAAQGILAEVASKEGANQLKIYWQQLPRIQRQNPAYQAAYIQQLLAQRMDSDAEQLLVDWQKKGPHALLLPLFRELKLPNPVKAVRALEGWLKTDEKNAELLSVLGQLSAHAGDLPLAEKALTKALHLRPDHKESQQDRLRLARVKELQQDDKQALSLYKKSLAVREG
ncbi:heme biosynthesis HemY N-terminal domain-containing protein [Lacimicrobium alkaliphilum]|uniref:Heme biosynthesis protein HemY n=1 Tax=Lacimicrobium alkaliphilum TaxID=1526571 RepID=A0ABQ1RJB1_9ALTE|nr:heme biosynthesis HemY N-terminal domain-containing protein [Lacimicrobium alkaliphilum]GGD70132.1 heme biosynthesis protein HemY [Lacimicrobium alkaliphilum]